MSKGGNPEIYRLRTKRYHRTQTCTQSKRMILIPSLYFRKVFLISTLFAEFLFWRFIVFRTECLKGKVHLNSTIILTKVFLISPFCVQLHLQDLWLFGPAAHCLNFLLFKANFWNFYDVQSL